MIVFGFGRIDGLEERFRLFLFLVGFIYYIFIVIINKFYNIVFFIFYFK